MTGWKSRLKWVSLVLRLSLAMQLCAASIAFFLHKPAGSETSSPWLGPPLPNFASWVLASGFIWLAVSMVIGFYKRSSLLISSLLLVVLSWIHLITIRSTTCQKPFCYCYSAFLASCGLRTADRPRYRPLH